MDESTKVLGSTSLNLTKMAEAQVKALRSFERDLSTQSANIKVLPPEPATASEDDFPEDLNTMEDHLYNASERSLRPQHPPPTTLPCANVQPSKYKICKDPGTMACSACKLVSYCSKVSNKQLPHSRFAPNEYVRNAKMPTGNDISKVMFTYNLSNR